MTVEQNKAITETVQKERKKLLGFIRKRIPDPSEAEDVLQDVFYQLTESYRLPEPIEQVSAWLFTVARNKITDLFRKKRPELLKDQHVNPSNDDTEAEGFNLADILPDTSAGPEASMFRKAMIEELEEALDELPEEQREVFVMHELEDKSFKEIAGMTGEQVNTLISRKRYAVLFLRERLRDVYNEFNL